MKGTKSEGGVYGKDLSPPEGVFLEKLDEIILPYNKVFCTECLGTCSQHFFFFTVIFNCYFPNSSQHFFLLNGAGHTLVPLRGSSAW